MQRLLQGFPKGQRNQHWMHHTKENETDQGLQKSILKYKVGLQKSETTEKKAKKVPFHTKRITEQQHNEETRIYKCLV